MESCNKRETAPCKLTVRKRQFPKIDGYAIVKRDLSPLATNTTNIPFLGLSPSPRPRPQHELRCSGIHSPSTADTSLPRALAPTNPLRNRKPNRPQLASSQRHSRTDRPRPDSATHRSICPLATPRGQAPGNFSSHPLTTIDTSSNPKTHPSIRKHPQYYIIPSSCGSSAAPP